MSSVSTLVILVRHADREFVPKVPDDLQGLTPKGRKQSQSLGAKLLQVISAPASQTPQTPLSTTIIFSSPALRCMQTAQILGNFLHPQAGVQPAQELIVTSPSVVSWSLGVIGANLGIPCLVLVSHKPELFELSTRLCSGNPLELKDAEAAGIEVATTGNGMWQVGMGKLLWRVRG